mmetsp:Transcript_52367/g.94323  ORF Transcript_52367/g.94323 Transcript_52367/m.94323 type:complete len:94 (+) Transcript_52367:37-318(+)
MDGMDGVDKMDHMANMCRDDPVEIVEVEANFEQDVPEVGLVQAGEHDDENGDSEANDLGDEADNPPSRVEGWIRYTKAELVAIKNLPASHATG